MKYEDILHRSTVVQYILEEKSRLTKSEKEKVYTLLNNLTEGYIDEKQKRKSFEEKVQKLKEQIDS